MEEITEGERVREDVIEGKTGDDWTELCRGHSVGHKRIDTFTPVDVSAIRWRRLKAVGEPRLRRLAAYRVAK